MKIKTSDLVDKSLNWAGAKCEGYTLVFFDDYFRQNGYTSGASEGRVESMLDFQPLKGEWARLNAIGGCTEIYNYASDWAYCGPIIEREKLEISPCYWNSDGWHWAAYMLGPCNLEDNFEHRGPTPLIAAMRCYVASKIGDEVEIPDELVDNL